MAPALPRRSYLRLLLAALACATLPGCSKIRDVLIINRFHESVQVKICMEKTTVPADGHAFMEHRQYMPSTGTYAYIYTEKGKLIGRITFSYNTADTDDDSYQDDLIIVDVGPDDL